MKAWVLLPAVLALEKVGPQRFVTTLRAAGVAPGLAKDETAISLGIADRKSTRLNSSHT